MTTQTGTAKAALTEALAADFSTFAEDVDKLRERAEILSTDCAGLNCAAGFWTGVALQLRDARQAVEKELADVRSKLTGRPKVPVAASVDADHLDRVRQAKEVA